jgi:ABC-type amino acid transport substrate-binding protein
VGQNRAFYNDKLKLKMGEIMNNIVQEKIKQSNFFCDNFEEITHEKLLFEIKNGDYDDYGKYIGYSGDYADFIAKQHKVNKEKNNTTTNCAHWR